MASTLKVFGLPGHTDDAELLQMFAVFGPVASASLCDEEGSTQRSGLVTFGTHQAALAAMSHMKGRHHRGACLSVQLAGFSELHGAGAGGDGPTRQRVAGFSELHGAGAGGDGPTRQRVAGGRLVGTVSSWLGAYGWIEPDGRLDHSAAGKHDGKVFLSSRDLGAAPPPKPGDRLSFALYFDSDGLGAHEVGPPDKGGGPGRVAVDAAVALLPGSVEVRVLGWPPSLEDAFPKTFAHFGTVCSHTFERPQRQGARSSGAVTFSSLHSARLAVEAMDGKPYGGKPLSVRFADPEQEKAARPLAPPAAPPGGGALGESAAAARSPGGGPLVRSEGPDQRHTGTVRQWTATKHFGWIAPDGPLSVQDPQGRKDVYFERRDLEGEAPAKLRVGSRVSFQLYTDAKGLGAAKVRVEAGDRMEVLEARRAERAAAAAAAAAAKPWWHRLAGDCCPISLAPLEELPYEPFGLSASSSVAGGLEEGEGLWGPAAVAALEAGELGPVHWFDGRFLACSLVGQGCFVDPLSMRPLARRECESLDGYLAHIGLPRVGVTEAFDLAAEAAAGGEAADLLRQCLEQQRETARRALGEAEEAPAPPGPPPCAPAAASGSPTAAGSPAAPETGKRRRWGRDK